MPKTAIDDESLRRDYAARVPVYVRELADGFAAIETASGEALSSEHATARQALAAALELAALSSAVKRAHFRALDTGDADGEWRWLDACAEEDEPIYGARLTRRAMWSLAASVNERASAVPIDGGGDPEGLGVSRAHGSGENSDELATGWVHLGVPVIGADERTHLYLYSELLPAIAARVDRGMLAYGSVGFGWDDADADPETGDVYEATLLHHALLNQPAVKTLTPGSERQATMRTAVRTRRLDMSQPTKAPKTIGARILPFALALALRAAADPELYKALRTAPKDKRGPALEKLRALAAAAGMTPEQAMEGDDYRPALVDVVCKLIEAGKLETILEGNAAAVATGEQAGALKAVLAKTLRAWTGPREQVDAALAMMEGDTVDLDALTKVLEGLAAAAGEKPKAPKEPPPGELSAPPPAGQRAIEGLDGAGIDAFATDMLGAARAILGKPEATPAEALAELQAMQDFLAAAVAKKGQPEDGQPSESPSGAPTGAESTLSAIAQNAATRAADALRAENAAMRARLVRETELRPWLRRELAIRKLDAVMLEEVVTEAGERKANPDFESLLDAAAKQGKDFVLATLKLAARPPMGGSVLPKGVRTGNAASDGPRTISEATDRCEPEAREACAARGIEPTSPAVRATAQKIAAERWPHMEWGSAAVRKTDSDNTTAA